MSSGQTPGTSPFLPDMAGSDPILSALNDGALLDDICGSDPKRLGAALQATNGRVTSYPPSAPSPEIAKRAEVETSTFD